jgi:hypothetical protein
MSTEKKWSELVSQLANLGYLEPTEARAIRRDADISRTITRAIQEARKSLREPKGIDYDGEVIGRVGDIDKYEDLLVNLNGRYCGTPDKGGTIGALTFGRPGGRWRKRASFSFSVDTTGCNLGAAAQTPITNAFARWQANSPVIFAQQAINSGEDVRVIFGGNEVDSRFGAPGGVLASAAYPENGSLQFDNSESWTAASLEAVAIHEIGHVLGLSHSNRPGGTMYPYSTPSLAIDAESREAVAALYGWQPQRQLNDRATSDRAALGRTSSFTLERRADTLHMVWKGVGEDPGIYTAHLDDGALTWSPQERLPGGCSHSPSLVEIRLPGGPNTGLLMAWKGVRGDHGIYWSQNTGAGWTPQQRVPGVGTSAGPSLASANGIVYMAWKGASDDPGIYWSSFSGGGWAAQQRITGVGTSDSPAMAAEGSRLFMFWKGVRGDTNGYYTLQDVLANPIWQPQRRIEFFANFGVAGGERIAIGMQGAPSAATRGGGVLVAWRGPADDSQIWFSILRDDEFSGQIAVPNVGTSSGPAVAGAGDRTYMAWRGLEGDDTLWWSWL